MLTRRRGRKTTEKKEKPIENEGEKNLIDKEERRKNLIDKEEKSKKPY